MDRTTLSFTKHYEALFSEEVKSRQCDFFETLDRICMAGLTACWNWGNKESAVLEIRSKRDPDRVVSALTIGSTDITDIQTFEFWDEGTKLLTCFMENYSEVNRLPDVSKPLMDVPAGFTPDGHDSEGSQDILDFQDFLKRLKGACLWTKETFGVAEKALKEKRLSIINQRMEKEKQQSSPDSDECDDADERSLFEASCLIDSLSSGLVAIKTFAEIAAETSGEVAEVFEERARADHEDVAG